MTTASTLHPERYRRPVVRFGSTYRHVRRVADRSGALWPALAHTCTTCGWPVDKVTYPTHPNCDGGTR